jgi:phosphoribosylformylglycinamidine (FGAM) synthase PurS component
MKAKVHVSLKAGVLDPQGKAVGDALGRLGFDEVGRSLRQDDRAGACRRPRPKATLKSA